MPRTGSVQKAIFGSRNLCHLFVVPSRLMTDSRVEAADSATEDTQEHMSVRDTVGMGTLSEP